MGEKTAIGEREQGHPLENVPSIAAPATQEAFVEKLPASQTSDAESGPKMEKLSKQETEPEYPSLRRVIPIVAALYMCFFLVALVRCPTLPYVAPPRASTFANTCIGPHNHSHCCSSNNRRIPLPGRRRMVWLCLHAHRLFIPPPHGPRLHLL